MDSRRDCKAEKWIVRGVENRMTRYLMIVYIIKD